MSKILSIREFNYKLKNLLENHLPYIWVKGEVTNFMRASSGHLYFSLKDGDDILNCVWFQRNQAPQDFDPLTGEVWEEGNCPHIADNLQNGQEIICAGRLSLYGPRGQHQLIVEYAQQQGLGQLYEAFEKLKKKLFHEGIFDLEYKKTLPKRIQNVALITAPTGAVIHDFMRIIKNRGTGAHIHLYPSLVQGDEAVPQLIEALKKAQSDNFPHKEKADVIIFIRGGGSIQDLWAFNDENLARALFACPIPIITGIGHEPDNSIADYVADIRAATPSHVAQMLWPERINLEQQVDDLEYSMNIFLQRHLKTLDFSLSHQSQKLHLLSPVQKLSNVQEQVSTLAKRLNNAISKKLEFSFMHLENRQYKLERNCPNPDLSQAHIDILLKSLQRSYQQKIQEAEQSLVYLEKDFGSLGEKMYTSRKHELENLELRLQNPLSPLEQGFALVHNGKDIVRSAHNITQGDKLELTFKDGLIETLVQKSPQKSSK